VAGYKTGAGIEPALAAQFHPLEERSARWVSRSGRWSSWKRTTRSHRRAPARAGRERAQVAIWTPDKDLAQCVRGDRVVQVMRRARLILDAAGVRAKFGVDPERIPDFLALVGDEADGYPGIEGIGRVGAAQLIQRYGALEEFPASVLGGNRDRALLFKDTATLRSDAPLFSNVEELRWRGPGEAFPAVAAQIGDDRLLQRCLRAARATLK
jgi:5'-3' exonuclease